MWAELGGIDVSETKTMRPNVIKWLKAWDAYPIENSVWPGTPDVNYIHGWIELKKLPDWPVRPNTPVQVEHFTPQQRIWLKRRCKKGGDAWLLLQVKRDWLLFDGTTAALYLGKGTTRRELMSVANCVSREGMTKERLMRWLRPN